MTQPTMQALLEAGVHFGHLPRYHNPKMKPYIYGVKKIHIIDLGQTLDMMRHALAYVYQLAEKNTKILFVGTKISAQEIIREEAKRCGMPYVDHRWLGGTLTNFKTIRRSIKRLKELETMEINGVFEKMIKKEALMLKRELTKLQRSLGGIRDMGGLPDALFVVDVGHEKIAISEANKVKIPVIGIVDTNHSPESIDYVIPGNDDAMSSIYLYARAISDTVLAARDKSANAESTPVAESTPAVPTQEDSLKKDVETKGGE